MSLLCWNCKGLGNHRTVRDLCRRIKEKCPNLVFLMETKLRSNKLNLIKYKTGFQNLFVVDGVGRSGGLALFWDEDIDVQIKNYSKRHINAKVIMKSRGVPWMFTGFY